MASDTPSMPDNRPAGKIAWQHFVAKYQRPSTRCALWQLLDTFVPYGLLSVVMYLSLEVSWWLTLPLAALAGALLLRIFIIFHDCGHGSYFKSRWANDTLGFIAGVLTFTPYYHWRWEHASHHGSSGDLNKRGMGDVWMMTVQEYLHHLSPPWRLHNRSKEPPARRFRQKSLFVVNIGKPSFPVGKQAEEL